MSMPTYEVDLFETPNGEAFSWIASYNDETVLREFEKDGEGYKRHMFADIDKEKLAKFGIGGFGNHLFFDVKTGIFNILGNSVEIRVRNTDTNELHTFTNVLPAYDDLIMYRRGESLPPSVQYPNGKDFVTGYFFGYKAKTDNFQVKFIITCLGGEGIGLEVRLVPDSNFNGDIILRAEDQEQVLSSTTFESNTATEFTVQLVNTSQQN